MNLKDSWQTNLLLAYQSLGVVYGDLSVSPLYVYKCTFADDIHHTTTNEDIFGVLSSVFWTLTLIPLFKYVFIVLRADDNGEGGTFALYSLICRHAKVSLLPNRQAADEALSTYKLNHSPQMNNNSWLKKLLEKHKFLHTALLVLVLLGTCMVIGDGLLTPAISVFAAVSGLELSISKDHHQYVVVPISCLILVFLFALQHYGTHRIGFCFAPVVLIWLLCLSALGIYNIIHWNPRVYKALSPHYMINFFKKTRKGGWLCLGGILLCITGTEAMFADLGHFSYTAIQIAFTFLVYPAMILAYMGEAAYLSKHHHRIHKTGFYVSVPESVRWPVIIVAVLASVVGSQAIISGTFSIINQSQSLGCFPRVKVVHTSQKIHGQIYIPEINWMLMILCIAVTIGFRDIKYMGNASGLAVMAVMLVTTCLTSLVIILCWHKPSILALLFLLLFGSIETLYFSASAIKFLEGAWVPILLSFFLVTIMYIWHYATVKKYEYDLNNEASLEWLIGVGPTLRIARVPGIGLVFTNLTSGIPANFTNFLTKFPAFHRILVFVCIKYIPVPYVPQSERYLMGRVGPRVHRSYRCIIRHGYRDVNQDAHSFESELMDKLDDFIRYDWLKKCNDGPRSSAPDECQLAVMGTLAFPEEECGGVGVGSEVDFGLREELCALYEARELGLAFVLGNSHVRTKRGSSLLKRFAINFGYNVLRKNCRRPDVALNVPPPCLLEVGVVYVV